MVSLQNKDEDLGIIRYAVRFKTFKLVFGFIIFFLSMVSLQNIDEDFTAIRYAARGFIEVSKNFVSRYRIFCAASS